MTVTADFTQIAPMRILVTAGTFSRGISLRRMGNVAGRALERVMHTEQREVRMLMPERLCDET